ncbi:MAG TPA: hypothetical protein VFA12_20510 [Stellaceae bacterium]|nr:hypothetical protein [Stellaceae bacterium]
MADIASDTIEINSVDGDAEAERPVDAALDRIIDRFRPALRTLSGDMRDEVLEFVRHQPKQFKAMSEGEQRLFGNRIDDLCRTIVRRAVDIIAADSRVTIGVQLEQVAFKPKGIEAKLTFAAVDAAIRHALVDAQGQRIMIVVSDPERYFGERAPAKIEADQPGLPLGRDEPELPLAGEAMVQAAAQREGYVAGLRGDAAEANPHPLGTVERQQWSSDWLAAAAQKRGRDAPFVNEALQAGYADGFSSELTHADLYEGEAPFADDYSIGRSIGIADRAPEPTAEAEASLG